jgi:flagellar biosynthetic protein FlhB
MAEIQDSAERTEAPTPKKRRDTREKGKVARSQELNSLIILSAGTLIILGFHPFVIGSIERIFFLFFRTSPQHVDLVNIRSVALAMFVSFLPIVTPFFLGIIAAGLLVNIGQVGFHFTANVLSPDLERINPISGLKRILSWRTIFEVLKGVIKIGVIGLVAYSVLKPAVTKILSLPLSSHPDLVGMLLKVGVGIALRALLVMVVIAGLDYAFQFWQHEKSIRMSLRELRDELKETEGDPLVRERVRSIQREIARRRMLENVKTADVVLTNPTTLAVALKYKPGSHAPEVVAKGRRYLAEKIRRIAEDFKVPIIENRPLAWALYKSCKIGEHIPVHLYRAVAEILAYVYSLKKRTGP